ncbi:MAG: hypothetical protein ACUVQ0_06825 [Thermoproteota archaeon]
MKVRWGWRSLFTKHRQTNSFTGILLSIVLLLVTLPAPNIVSVKPDETSPMTYDSCIIVIPKGTMADNVVWKYIYDTPPTLGWNVKPEFNDTLWLEGKDK